MSLNLLLRHSTYSSLYDLYVYKLNATDRDAWQHDKLGVKKKYYKDNVMLPYVSMTNESFIFFPRIMGLNGLIVEQGMFYKEKGMLNYFIGGTYPYFVKYEKRL